MEAIAATGLAEIVGVADATPGVAEQTAALVPGAAVGQTLADVLAV